jgi:hypothetical protein
LIGLLQISRFLTTNCQNGAKHVKGGYFRQIEGKQTAKLLHKNVQEKWQTDLLLLDLGQKAL